MHERPRAPIRTCVGCRRRAPANELVRIRRTADGGFEVGRGDGRGAWVCAPAPGRACLDDAAKRGALARALRVAVSSADVDDLHARLEGLRDA